MGNRSAGGWSPPVFLFLRDGAVEAFEILGEGDGVGEGRALHAVAEAGAEGF